jgi:ACS family hexuronate transporter-like MFS transporter
MITPELSTRSMPAVRIGDFRWVICALPFFATTIKYIDRQIIGILKPTLAREFQWSDERDYLCTTR